MNVHLTPTLLAGVAALVLAALLWLLRRRVSGSRRGLEQFMPIAAWLTAVLGAWLLLSSVTPDRTPWSDSPNPLPRTVTTAAAGEQLYQANCAACHGVDARGGGPKAGTTPVRPPSLVGGHTAAHTDGDLAYWIANGLPGGMPAWGSTLTETEQWAIVTYVRSLNEPLTPIPSAVVLPLGLAGGFIATLFGWLAVGRPRPHPVRPHTTRSKEES